MLEWNAKFFSRANIEPGLNSSSVARRLYPIELHDWWSRLLTFLNFSQPKPSEATPGNDQQIKDMITSWFEGGAQVVSSNICLQPYGFLHFKGKWCDEISRLLRRSNIALGLGFGGAQYCYYREELGRVRVWLEQSYSLDDKPLLVDRWWFNHCHHFSFRTLARIIAILGLVPWVLCYLGLQFVVLEVFIYVWNVFLFVWLFSIAWSMHRATTELNMLLLVVNGLIIFGLHICGFGAGIVGSDACFLFLILVLWVLMWTGGYSLINRNNQIPDFYSSKLVMSCQYELVLTQDQPAECIGIGLSLQGVTEVQQKTLSQHLSELQQEGGDGWFTDWVTSGFGADGRVTSDVLSGSPLNPVSIVLSNADQSVANDRLSSTSDQSADQSVENDRLSSTSDQSADQSVANDRFG